MALRTVGLGTTIGERSTGNIKGGNYHQDKLGKQREATGGKGFVDFRARNDHCDKLEHLEAMVLVTCML